MGECFDFVASDRSQNRDFDALNYVVSDMNEKESASMEEGRVGERGRGSPELGCVATGSTYLLHDTSLPLGEGDVATRLILDKLDLDLAALTAGLVVIIIIVLGAHAVALGATGVGAVTRLLQVIVLARGELLVDGSHVGHDGGKGEIRGLEEKGRWGGG